MMSERFLRNAPPILGLIMMAVLFASPLRNPLLAIGGGLLVWFGSAAALRSLSQVRDLRTRVLKVPDARVRQDMRAALAKVETLRTLSARIPDVGISQQLDALATKADFLIGEAVRSPSAAGRVQKPLALYLDDALTLSAKYADLQRFEDLTEAEIAQTKGSLARLVDLFEVYRQRVRKAEALDLDVQITVLEQRLETEGLLRRRDD